MAVGVLGHVGRGGRRIGRRAGRQWGFRLRGGGGSAGTQAGSGVSDCEAGRPRVWHTRVLRREGDGGQREVARLAGEAWPDGCGLGGGGEGHQSGELQLGATPAVGGPRCQPARAVAGEVGIRDKDRRRAKWGHSGGLPALARRPPLPTSLLALKRLSRSPRINPDANHRHYLQFILSRPIQRPLFTSFTGTSISDHPPRRGWARLHPSAMYLS